MAYFTKRYHTPGTPPGTLVTAEAGSFRIRLIDYTDSEFLEKDLAHAQECRPYLERSTVTWIHVCGEPQAETMHQLGELFRLHPLALEDVINRGQRPKLDEFDGQLFVIMAMPQINAGHAEIEQISAFAGRGYVITFCRGDSDPFEPVRQRLRKRAGKLRARGADYLLYSLLDIVIDTGFPVLESFGDDIESVEDELLEKPTQAAMQRLHELRREFLLLRRMLWPQREVVNSLMRGNLEFISDETTLYLRDCYDHVIQIMDLLETYRDMTANLLDVYLSSLSNRLNDVMRVLTVIATVFMPLTFIVGVYGMNFGTNDKSPWAMPELGWYYGYPMVWMVIGAVAAGMILYFKRRGWF
ncbi:MAG: magnesium transporter [Gammaproteobacteria bacterium SG8_47]|nr:MAG: magnesium transporter [Gammaproteobacteria bacterium SG8_47]